MIRGEFQRDKFLLNHDQPEDFTRCFWQKKPKVLPAWIVLRVIITLYFFCASITIVIYMPDPGFVWYKSFIYISTWNFFLQTLAFSFALSISAARFAKEKKGRKKGEEELPPMEKMPWEYKLFWLLYITSAANALFISFMYWFFVYDPEINTDTMYAIESKVFNSLIMIIDFFLSAMPYRFNHFYVPLLFCYFYTMFTCVYQLSGGTGNVDMIPVYPFMDWRYPVHASAACLICLASNFICHVAMFMVHLLKLWIKKKREEAI